VNRLGDSTRALDRDPHRTTGVTNLLHHGAAMVGPDAFHPITSLSGSGKNALRLT